MKVVAATELGGLVAVERHVEGTDAAVAGGLAAFVGELGREVVPEPHRVQPELQQRLLAPRSLADGGQHPGGDSRRARGKSVGSLQDAHREPALGGAPGTGEADDAAAGNQHFVSFCHLRPPSLHRHYPDQVPTVGGAVAALSALVGSRVHLQDTPAD